MCLAGGAMRRQTDATDELQSADLARDDHEVGDVAGEQVERVVQAGLPCSLK